MNIVINNPSLMLDRSQTIELVDAAGAVAALASGCLWITMDGDRRDIVLRAGDRWTIERNGRTLVQAQTASRLKILSAPRSGGALPSALHRFADTVRHRLAPVLKYAGAQFTSTRNSPVPYY